MVQLYEYFEQSKDEFQQMTHYNMQQYGFPVLHAAFGGKWLEDLYSDVAKLLDCARSVPLEIIVKPEDPELHHWSLEFYVLAQENGRLVRAIEYERKKQEGK
jgi:hypothetical protein